jgi:very-short-patch-repair endonuclease
VLDARDVTSVGAIPCTTVARTLVDLAGVVTRRELERACERAEQLRVFDLGALVAALDRAGPRPGVAALRSLLAEGLGETHTRSELEERFLELCRSAGLPRPQPNAWLGVLEVDFLWSAQRLVVETDGRAFHGTPQAFERDRDRDRRLLLAGYRVVRFTWRQVTGTPEVVAETVRALLGSPP